MTEEPSAADSRMPAGLSRRRVLLGGAAAAAFGAGAALGTERLITSPDGSVDQPPDLLAWHTGRHQCGVDVPARPPHHLLFSALTWSPVPGAGHVRQTLRHLGEAILDIVADPPVELLPDGPVAMTVQVGLGPRAVQRFGDDRPGGRALPEFAGSSRIDPRARGGDLVLLVASDDSSVLAPVTRHLIALVNDFAPTMTVAWQQQGLRPDGKGPRTRTPLGHHDGVVVPDDAEDMAAGVWIAEGPAAGGTVGVARRFDIDHQAFDALSADQQDAVIGRRRIDGAPLSGGTIDDDVDLFAKSPDGRYLIPAHAHIRAAHPSFTASPLMMRRSYGFSRTDRTSGLSSPGLLFLSYQNTPDTFIRTQLRMDEMDDLMTYTTATAETSFLVLPGFDHNRPLGSTL